MHRYAAYCISILKRRDNKTRPLSRTNGVFEARDTDDKKKPIIIILFTYVKINCILERQAAILISIGKHMTVLRLRCKTESYSIIFHSFVYLYLTVPSLNCYAWFICELFKLSSADFTYWLTDHYIVSSLHRVGTCYLIFWSRSNGEAPV